MCTQIQKGVEMILTDQQVMFDLLQKNVAANVGADKPSTASVAVLDWLGWYQQNKRKSSYQYLSRLQPNFELLPRQPPFDLILGADVIYKVDLVEPLVHCLETLSNTNSLILISTEIRCPVAHDTFLQRAAKSFTIRKVREIFSDWAFQISIPCLCRFLKTRMKMMKIMSLWKYIL